MIIDVHTHFSPPGYLAALERGPDPFAIGRAVAPPAIAGILGDTAARLFPRLATRAK